MLLQAQLPLSRKIMLFLLLCAGVFVMIAAILRVVFVFKVRSSFAPSRRICTLADTRQNADAATPAIWACRETLVAMLVSNAPLIRPMLSARWWRGEYSNNSKPRSSGYPTISGNHKGHIELESQKSNSAHIYSSSGKHEDDSSSTEHIVQPKDMMGIRVQRNIDIVSNKSTR